MRYLLSQAILYQSGKYDYQEVAQDVAKQWICQGEKAYISYIGDEEEDRELHIHLRDLTKKKIPSDGSGPLYMKPGDEALVVQKNTAPPTTISAKKGQPPRISKPEWVYGILRRIENFETKPD